MFVVIRKAFSMNEECPEPGNPPPIQQRRRRGNCWQCMPGVQSNGAPCGGGGHHGQGGDTAHFNRLLRLRIVGEQETGEDSPTQMIRKNPMR